MIIMHKMVNILCPITKIHVVHEAGVEPASKSFPIKLLVYKAPGSLLLLLHVIYLYLVNGFIYQVRKF